jgi:hypothetical protein
MPRAVPDIHLAIYHMALFSIKATSSLIVDKTVPKSTYREYNALMWILNNLKYTSKQSTEGE